MEINKCGDSMWSDAGDVDKALRNPKSVACAPLG